MLVSLRHPEPANGVSLEVELDKHRGLGSHNPSVVPRLDYDDLWSYELQRAAVCVLDMDFTAGQETDVGVHAEVSTDDRLHISGPAKSGRVDHALNATSGGSDDIELDAADVTAFASFERREEWISDIHEILPLKPCVSLRLRLNCIKPGPTLRRRRTTHRSAQIPGVFDEWSWRSLMRA